jgi:hypothetical protein
MERMPVIGDRALPVILDCFSGPEPRAAESPPCGAASPRAFPWSRLVAIERVLQWPETGARLRLASTV